MNIFKKLWAAIFPASAEPEIVDIRVNKLQNINPTFSEQWKPAEKPADPSELAPFEFPKSKPAAIKPQTKKTTTKKTTGKSKKK